MSQVSVRLDGTAFDRLKRLASTSGQPYAAIISRALEVLDSSASDGLAPASGFRVYAQLPEAERRAWRGKVRQWRGEGQSFGGIARRLFQEYRIAGAYNLPLHSSTIRGMASIGPE
ncbi:MAG: hypothetical protein RKO25_06520 [Candidatus Contendobacter sp.]|nr:hypothetical protein [Candidatus Contendobacter sp.]